MVKPLAVVAVGGNALIQDDKRNSIPDQYVAVMESVQHIVDMVEAGWDLVLTHGNGPQVGFIWSGPAVKCCSPRRECCWWIRRVPCCVR